MQPMERPRFLDSNPWVIAAFLGFGSTPRWRMESPEEHELAQRDRLTMCAGTG